MSLKSYACALLAAHNASFDVVWLRNSLDRVESEREIAFLRTKETIDCQLPPSRDRVVDCYLLIMMLNRLTFFKSNGFASFFSFPRYVGFIARHGTNNPSSLCDSKSYSQLIVDCSRPSAISGRISSLSVSVYFLPSCFPRSR